ncbi:FAD:protein FMN transferase [Rathayibacter sp. VKM Ac-2835]|uniref:FAD:protein FMN transferase n=1 Tax=Rathayibacter sp. VKM Ac-2835 TaxID=2739043 RepID=UPI0015637B02|nr:FAD:protein FMN transferase [Rathayibacter sp. VKM Ac-2835]NRG41081.1 FAD:protein FMN transferase [Rathayibacter sp. VKM Ac-2835]
MTPDHREEPFAQHAWELWTTTAQVVVHSSDLDVLAEAERHVRAVTTAVENACSRFRSDSELMARSAALIDGTHVSPMLAALVRIALAAARATDGDVDPSLGVHMTHLGYDRAQPLTTIDVPTTTGGTLDNLRALPVTSAAWRDIQLRGDWIRVPEGVVLDLGATAKAAAADMAAAAAAQATGVGVLVSLGGDIATAGPGPTSGWQVLVEDLPEDPSQTISLQSGWAIATSSTRRRRWGHDGASVHHILDPRWGIPAEPVWRSVTVAAPTCVTANTWSTAAVVRGRRAASELAAARRASRLVDASRHVITTPAWPAP